MFKRKSGKENARGIAGIFLFSAIPAQAGIRRNCIDVFLYLK